MRFQLPIDPRGARRARISGWVSSAVVALLLIVVGQLAWIGFEGSRQAVEVSAHSANCQTPASAFDWSYEAINYAKADDSVLDRFPDRLHCANQGTTAGTDLAAADGTRIAGWWIPSASRQPVATLVLAHDHGANKSDLLAWAAVLHDRYDLVLFDFRAHGQSGGAHSTVGTQERTDLGAVIDWLEESKRSQRLAVLGIGMGAAAAVGEAASDPRVDALILDSSQATLASALQARLDRIGDPLALPGAWAILLGGLLRTGEDLSAADPVQAIAAYGSRPVLLVTGGRDDAVGPHDAQDLLTAAQDGGSRATLEICATAGHDESVSACPDDYAQWVLDFLAQAFATPS